MSTKPNFWTSLHGLATLLLIGAALYFLLVEHRAHTLQYLPFLILLLCPLMHIFMHKGQVGHSHKGHGSREIEEAYRRGLEEGRKASRKNP
jgi:hypothetical protein